MPKTNLDAAAVKRALYRKGTSLMSWSEANGYAYQTVLNAVDRHAGGHAREPWGQTTRAILRDLSREIGQEIVPDILNDRSAA